MREGGGGGGGGGRGEFRGTHHSREWKSEGGGVIKGGLGRGGERWVTAGKEMREKRDRGGHRGRERSHQRAVDWRRQIEFRCCTLQCSGRYQSPRHSQRRKSEHSEWSWHSFALEEKKHAAIKNLRGRKCS